MRAIVTGGAGFIGSHVAERLLAMGHEVMVIDDLSGGFADNVPKDARPWSIRRSIVAPLDDLFASFKPELVYHLAAYAAEGMSPHIPVFNYTNNLVGTTNVLAAAHRAGVRHFVFTSSMAVYGHGKAPFTEADPLAPCDPYGLAKAACEQHIRLHRDYFGGPDFTIIRPHNVYGPRQNIVDPYRNVIGIYMLRALRGQPFPVFGDGTQVRSFSYIDSTAQAITEAPFMPAARNVVINVGSDEPVTIRELVSRVARVLGVPEEIEWRVPRVEVKHAYSTQDIARHVFPHIDMDAVRLTEGLERMAAWVRAHPIPTPTRAPEVEIVDNLPPAWRA
jgi:UDP-glucose 4-epimerase